MEAVGRDITSVLLSQKAWVLYKVDTIIAVASLLSCLHQLRAENLRLEEHVNSLLQRRDHLLAVNARLAIPLTSQPAPGNPYVNLIGSYVVVVVVVVVVVESYCI
jgi:hypothetical protein